MVTIYYMTYEPERTVAFASARFMASYPWVDDIIFIHTDKDRPDLELFPVIPKVYHYWQFFGGTGISNSDGINEVDARNTGVILAELTTSDWILQCDSDEIFLAEPDFDINAILDYDAVLFETYNFVLPNRYRREGLTSYDGLYDPHIRLWRKRLRLRHAMPEHRIASCPNPTGHTHFMPCGINYLRMQRKLAHVHFHDLIPEKYRELDRLDSIEWQIQWPKAIIDSIQWRF